MFDTFNWPLLSAFIPTFTLTSLTPGMCMTLSLSLGVAVGVRRTLWMMAGELLGVGLVAVAAVAGVAALMLGHPLLFTLLKWIGGGYLVYLGIGMWPAPEGLSIATMKTPPTRRALAAQGFVTAVANPKGWAFFIALLPPFIDAGRPLPAQLSVLVTIILVIEFACLLLYARGGQALSRWLQHRGHLTALNRTTGVLLIGVGLWLALG